MNDPFATGGLVPEMAAACEDHGDAVLIAGGNDFVVAAGAARLNDRGDTRFRGAVLASDAFFPFDDSIHHAAAAGVAAVIQPGGSRRDDEVIAACNQHGIPMILTGRRHFRH